MSSTHEQMVLSDEHTPGFVEMLMMPRAERRFEKRFEWFPGPERTRSFQRMCVPKTVMRYERGLQIHDTWRLRQLHRFRQFQPIPISFSLLSALLGTLLLFNSLHH